MALSPPDIAIDDLVLKPVFYNPINCGINLSHKVTAQSGKLAFVPSSRPP